MPIRRTRVAVLRWTVQPGGMLDDRDANGAVPRVDPVTLEVLAGRGRAARALGAAA